MCVFGQGGTQIDPSAATGPVEPWRESTFAERVQIAMDDDGAPYRIVNPGPNHATDPTAGR
ncbi:MAG: hypothetical protein PHU85_03085 [Phycisphaerae bacterium]|nr:hypothetical protein [Phycisphaerae bacterium]